LSRSATLAKSPLVSTAARALCASFSTDVKNVTVLGSGLMGAGIAQVSAESGYNVTLFDVEAGMLEKAKGSLQKNMLRVLAKKKVEDSEAQKKVAEIMAKISLSTDVETCAKSADVVVEAIVENLGIKQKVFKTLDAAAPAHCLFASNTSSLPIGDIASAVSDKRQAQFGGLHFFNPVPMMKLVEVIKHSKTDDATFDSLTAFGKSVGKTTVSCKDTPGFVVNRLLVPYLMEAIRMYERGDATLEDIDVAMKLGCGHPMGPFTLADYVGLDTTKFIIDGWAQRYPDVGIFKPSELLNKMVAEGKLGLKSGQGFYDYSKK